MNSESRFAAHDRAALAPVAGLGPFSAIFADETSQTKHRYLAIGALVVPLGALADLEAALTRARLPDLPLGGEMKWGKVSTAKLAAYKRVVDAFFSFPITGHRTEFHCLHADTHLLRDRVYNDGSREVGFNKEVYQLLRKVGILHPTRFFHVYLDARSTPPSPGALTPTEHLRYMLNCDARRAKPDRDWPFRRLHFRESSESMGIQLVDVLLGSVAFRLNDHRNAPGASPAKCELSDYIATKVPYWNAVQGTARTGRFTIWQRQLRK